VTDAATDDPNAKRERHLVSHAFNLLVLVGGAVGLVVMMRKLGWANAREVYEDVRGWFFVILGLDLAGMAIDAMAIHTFMRPEARMISYWRVFAAQASGRAINIFVPGAVVGEATKISMLVTHAPRDRMVSSIVLYNLATFYISVAIVIIGVPLTVLTVDLPHDLTVVVWTGLAVLVPIVVVIGVIIHRGALDTVLSSAQALHLLPKARADKWKVKFADVDRHLKELHSTSPGTRLGVLLLGISRVVAWASTTVVLFAVGVHLHPTLLVGVLSVGVLISWMSAIVPFGIGVADGSNYALFDVLGASGAHGVFVTLLGRARTLVIALFGLVVMAAGHTANRISVARRNRRLTAARLAKVAPPALT
jgi:uncharacterized membrane protein YbhN (UPF0104 family)